MSESVFDFNRDELQRIDYIADAIDANDISSLNADDLVLWGDWQRTIESGKNAQAESVAENRAKIAEIAAKNRADAIKALDRLAELTDSALNRVV